MQEDSELIDARLIAIEALLASLPGLDDTVIDAARRKLEERFAPSENSKALYARIGRQRRKPEMQRLAEQALDEIASART